MRNAAFTLVELAIVLVIIGLIAGGILVGRELVSAAEVRAQLSQIEKIKTATKIFYDKTGYLPGDIPDPVASSFGLAARGTARGQGDGDGLITGSNGSSRQNFFQVNGEAGLFWVDLSALALIEGNFNTATATANPTFNEGTFTATYLPTAAVGNDSSVFVSASHDYMYNYITVLRVRVVTSGRVSSFARSMTAGQAYAMDSKMDDGIPSTGLVLAAYPLLTGIGGYWMWANLASGLNISTAAVSGSPTTCYDNAGNAGVTPTYSVAQASSGKNCFLSFRLN